MNAPVSADRRLQSAAHNAVTAFVNAQNCQTEADVLAALNSLAAMTAKAFNLVKYGKKENLS